MERDNNGNSTSPPPPPPLPPPLPSSSCQESNDPLKSKQDDDDDESSPSLVFSSQSSLPIAIRPISPPPPQQQQRSSSCGNFRAIEPGIGTLLPLTTNVTTMPKSSDLLIIPSQSPSSILPTTTASLSTTSTLRDDTQTGIRIRRRPSSNSPTPPSSTGIISLPSSSPSSSSSSSSSSSTPSTTTANNSTITTTKLTTPSTKTKTKKTTTSKQIRQSKTKKKKKKKKHHRDFQWNVGIVIQIVMVCIIFLLVFDTHCRVQETTTLLQQYKQQELNLMNQMNRIEIRAFHLQDQLQAMHKLQQQQHDDAIIERKRDQLADLVTEMNNLKEKQNNAEYELSNLQRHLQSMARNQIIIFNQEGNLAVQLNLELIFSNQQQQHKSANFVIQLFQDTTPHAVWVFLQQIQHGDWHGGKLTTERRHLILSSQKNKKSMHPSSSTLFIEQHSFHLHQQSSSSSLWIVCARDQQLHFKLWMTNVVQRQKEFDDICFGKIEEHSMDTIRASIDTLGAQITVRDLSIIS